MATASSIEWVTNTMVRPVSLPDPPHLVLHDAPVLGVEGAERLVHEQDVGLDGERARDGGPLAHAAADPARVVVLEAGEPGQPRYRAAAVAAAPRRRGRQGSEHEGDVLAQGHPGQEPVLLEDDAHPPAWRAARPPPGRRRGGPSPRVAGSMPPMMRSSVVFPQPLGPSRHTKSPASAPNDTAVDDGDQEVLAHVLDRELHRASSGRSPAVIASA